MIDDLIHTWEFKQEKQIYQIQDLEECFYWLQNIVTDYKIFGMMTEKKAINISSNGLCRYIRNELKLWEDYPKVANEKSSLLRWFNKRGVYHPDDISSIILTSWHRELNGKKLEIPKQIKKCRQYWKIVNPKMNKGK